MACSEVRVCVSVGEIVAFDLYFCASWSAIIGYTTITQLAVVLVYNFALQSLKYGQFLRLESNTGSSKERC